VEDAHKLRYKRSLREYEKTRNIPADRYWRCMLLLCTASPSLWDKVEAHLDMKRGEAWLGRVQGLSGGEGRLLSLAWHLYNQGTAVNIADLADSLDDTLWAVVLEALTVYRGGQ